MNAAILYPFIAIISEGLWTKYLDIKKQRFLKCDTWEDPLTRWPNSTFLVYDQFWLYYVLPKVTFYDFHHLLIANCVTNFNPYDPGIGLIFDIFFHEYKADDTCKLLHDDTICSGEMVAIWGNLLSSPEQCYNSFCFTYAFYWWHSSIVSHSPLDFHRSISTIPQSAKPCNVLLGRGQQLHPH